MQRAVHNRARHPAPGRKAKRATRLPAESPVSQFWSHFSGSNRGPTHYECVALPAELKWRFYIIPNRTKIPRPNRFKFRFESAFWCFPLAVNFNLYCYLRAAKKSATRLFRMRCSTD